MVTDKWKLLVDGILEGWDTLGVGEETECRGNSPEGKVWSVGNQCLQVELTQVWDSLEEWLGDVLCQSVRRTVLQEDSADEPQESKETYLDHYEDVSTGRVVELRELEV